MSPEFESLLAREVGKTFERQAVFAQLTSDIPFSFDTQTGRLEITKRGLFGKRLVYNAQILGSVDERESSFIWAWANSGSGLPAAVVAASLELKAMGEANKVPEFVTPQFILNLDEADEFRIALTACALLGFDAAFPASHPGGMVLLLVRNAGINLPPLNSRHVVTNFRTLISHTPISNHRVAFLGYLEGRGLEIEESGPLVRLKVGADTVEAEFDELDRLKRLHVRLTGKN